MWWGKYLKLRDRDLEAHSTGRYRSFIALKPEEQNQTKVPLNICLLQKGLGVN